MDRRGGSFLENRVIDLRHASPKHLILSGSAAVEPSAC